MTTRPSSADVAVSTVSLVSGTEASGSVSVSSVWGTVMMTPACSPFSRVTIVPSVSDPPHAESIRAVNMVAVAVISFLSI